MQINSYLLNKLNFKARNINFRSDILKIQVSQVNRKPSSWDIKGAQGFPHIAENE